MVDDPLVPPAASRLNRRQVILRGAPLLGLPALLAACGGEEAAPTAAPTEPPATMVPADAEATTAAPSPAPPTTVPATDAPVGPASPAPSAATPSTGGATPVSESAGVATPTAPEQQARLDRFMAVSALLVGGGRLDPERGQQFLSLVDADSERRSALDALLAAGPEAIATVTAPPAASPRATPIGATPEIGTGRGGSEVVATPEDAGAQMATPVATGTQTSGPAATPVVAGPDVRKEILTYWYRGVFAGAPVPERETFWFSLSAWQAVEYTAATSACKAFGWWATAPERGGVS